MENNLSNLSVEELEEYYHWLTIDNETLKNKEKKATYLLEKKEEYQERFKEENPVVTDDYSNRCQSALKWKKRQDKNRLYDKAMRGLWKLSNKFDIYISKLTEPKKNVLGLSILMLILAPLIVSFAIPVTISIIGPLMFVVILSIVCLDRNLSSYKKNADENRFILEVMRKLQSNEIDREIIAKKYELLNKHTDMLEDIVIDVEIDIEENEKLQEAVLSEIFCKHLQNSKGNYFNELLLDKAGDLLNNPYFYYQNIMKDAISFIIENGENRNPDLKAEEYPIRKKKL